MNRNVGDGPPRPLRTRLRRIAEELQVPVEAVLVDWTAGRLLAAIGETRGLADELVFKGGTALRKCYFNDWRFSLDLDFSAEVGRDCEQLLAPLQDACAMAAEAARDVGQLGFACRILRQRDPHPGGQCAFQIEVTLPWGEHTRVKVEVTQDEPMLLQALRREVHHAGYQPEPAMLGSILVYDVNEIAAEKLRAYLQVAQTLARRRARPDREAWVRGRSRDTYDLSRLYRKGALDIAVLTEILPRKARARGVEFRVISDFQRPELRPYYEADWRGSVVPIVPLGDAPAYADAAAGVDDLLRELLSV